MRQYFKIILIISSVLQITSSLGQNIEHTASIHHPSIELIHLDKNGDIYVTTNKGGVTKYQLDGKKLYQFDPVFPREIHQIVLQNPLKIILFNKDQQQYVQLNRFLTEHITYDFNREQFGYVTWMTIDIMQRLWLIDASDYSLNIFDPRTEQVVEKIGLSQIVSDDSKDIIGLTHHNKNIYIQIRATGILEFDNFGNYLRTIETNHDEAIRFYHNHFYYVDEGTLVLKDLRTRNESKTTLATKANLQTLFYDNRLLMVDSKGIEIYRIGSF